jgi:hypothetical protein
MKAAFLEAIHADPWAAEFVDLPSLNGGASDAIEDSIQRVRQIAKSEPRHLRSTSMVVLGPPGAGKTHLFARLRRRLGPRAVFVHVRPLVHAPITPKFVLSECVRQLGYATYDVPQASALVGSLLGHFAGSTTAFPTVYLHEFEQLAESERKAQLEETLERVLEIWQEAEEIYLRRLLEVPFAPVPIRRALLAWLSGADCEESQLSRIGAAASIPEERALAALQTLSAVAALGAPLVIVFDQLENLVERERSGERLNAYANLTSELVDAVRGAVLVHMALDTEWTHGIQPTFNLSQQSRIVMRRETLALPSPQQREELARLFVERVPERPAPFPWPFGEARLHRLRTEPGWTPRMLLIECRLALESDGRPEVEVPTTSEMPVAESLVNLTDGLDASWDKCLDAARRTTDEAAEDRTPVAAERIVDGLLACRHFLPPGFEIAVHSSPPAQLAIVDGGHKSTIAVVQHAHHRALGSALNKLTAMTARAPVIAIRERAGDLRPTWKDTLAKQRALLATGQARFLLVDHDDLVRLLALDELLRSARSGDVTNREGRPLAEDTVIEWVGATLEVPSWGILASILAAAPANSQADLPIDSRSADDGVPRPSSSVLALPIVRRLRVASLDRVVREALRIDPACTRSSIVAELEAAGASVRWFGRTVVCVRRGNP